MEHLDSGYLREMAGVIKDLAGGRRKIRRVLWNYWLQNMDTFCELSLENRKQRMGSLLGEQGFTGYGQYTMENVLK